MNKIRRSIVTLLLVTLTLSLTTGASARNLTDIESNWAKAHIERLVARQVINGYPDGTFRPERPVTRAEFAKMVTSAFSIDEGKNVNFKDIDGHWARSAILKLAGAGIVDGYPDGTFKPDAHINRAEAVSMLVRVLKLHDVKGFAQEPTFADVG